MKHVHIVGICGTAMAGLAAHAQESGWRVTGSDAAVYPPMSDFLVERGIPVADGYRAENVHPAPDLVLVGNAISRGNPELEAVLDRGIPFRSGAEWLFDHVLEGRHPIVVTGTHGKTTTASLTAWLWECAGWQPGFLIGGIPANFSVGARYPRQEWVVVEGDEYDTAFFDKRPKFLHYHPKTLILHNLEYDHADIYPDLEAIRRQFRLLLRIVPPSGLILANGDDPEIEALTRHAFGPVVRYGLQGEFPFTAKLEQPDGRVWSVLEAGKPCLTVTWNLLGRHNVMNGLAAAAAALIRGIDRDVVRRGLETFQGVARRLQLRHTTAGVSVYDDFAHHPTAIATTLQGLRAAVGEGRIWVILEPRSNTMRTRVHQDRLPEALQAADYVILARPSARGQSHETLLDVDAVTRQLNNFSANRSIVVDGAGQAVEYLTGRLASGDHVVVMSNGGFDGIHDRLQEMLANSDRRE
ncbi:MAG: UDP-N-acetylmuramate:L-alanyl-gamma-D-glutamyl-meso-diaminopimelate ligase [Magnetococcales bacterium]|nr:UDP-N-acetylmuramate:L-alanyl-gamma-D-glutamyl-meso-diaminopimelate ligase [Magnetococcales bacterium]MBF0323169.1 UDP-N-acetylmuramate:L-alanyl-gamma-D-glutamyl-meso-diaminopimelate ligase [Magnetococcales bacterium]